MATSTPVPTMSTQGWVFDPNTRFDYLLSHFFESDYNQTQLYKGGVTSLPRILEKHGNHIAGVCYGLEQELTSYLQRYYTAVEVTVIVDGDTTVNPQSQITLDIRVGVNEDGLHKDYVAKIFSENSKLKKVQMLNNYG